MCLRIKILTLGTKDVFYAVRRYHHLFLSAIFPLRCTTRGYTAREAGQGPSNKNFPRYNYWFKWMKDKYKFIREQDNQSLLFTWQHISARQQYSHSKGNCAVATSPSKLRALLENMWLQHHLLLSEYYQGSERSEHGDNNKLSLNLHTAAEEDCILPLGFLGIRQSKAGRPFAPTVPSLMWRGPHSRRNRDYKVPLFTGNQGLGNNCLN